MGSHDLTRSAVTTQEAEAYAIECRQLKTAIVSVDLSAIVLAGREVGISLKGEPASYWHDGKFYVYDGPDSGRLHAGAMEGSFVVESSEDGSQFEFPAYFLESISYDCDGSTIITLASDNGGGFEQTRDELAELNGYGDEEEGQHG